MREPPSSPRTYASVFKSNIDRFKVKPTAGAEVRVLAYSSGDTIEKSIRDSMMTYSHFKSVVPRIKYPETVEDPQYNIDMAKPPVALSAAISPRKLAMDFNSGVNRFPDNRNVNDLPYDIDTALVRPSVYKSVQSSARKVSTMSSRTPRSEVAEGFQVAPYNVRQKTLEHDLEKSSVRYAIMESKVDRGLPMRPRVGEVEYDPDCGPKATIATTASQMEASVVPFKSKVPRFRNWEKVHDRVYETDAGHKKSLAKEVEDSPLVFANMHINNMRPRPPRSARSASHAEVYNTDCGPKECLSTAVMNSPRVISTMYSTTPRFPPLPVAPCENMFYNTDVGPKIGLSKSVEMSPRKYSALSSDSARFKDYGSADKIDVVYDTDKGRKLSIAREVENSKVKYANVRSVIPRFKESKRSSTQDEYELLLQNPSNIELKFEIRGSTVVKKTSERAVIIVGRQ